MLGGLIALTLQLTMDVAAAAVVDSVESVVGSIIEAAAVVSDLDSGAAVDSEATAVSAAD